MWIHIKEQISKTEVSNWLPQYVAVAVGCGVAVRVISGVWKTMKRNRKLEQKQKELQISREKLENEIQYYNLDPDLQKEIVNLSVKALHNRLQSGKLKALDVLRAYQVEALKVDDRLNCISEPLLEATDLAVACDASREPLGFLHGMPFSVKENYKMIGYDSTIGMEYFINKPAKETAVLIKVMKNLGAIPFVRTNIPQTMMSYSCSNPVYGVTKNPYDEKRCPGGSSGGEAALIGGGGSLMGLGSDIGGSLRVPSHMCGTCTLKPTNKRLSYKGCFSLGRGQTLVQTSLGPIGRDVDTIVMMFKALLCQDMFDLDPNVAPIPFRNEIFKETRPLKIGFYTEDGAVQAVPSNIRAVHIAKTVLEKMGHTVVPFEPPNVSKAITSLYAKALTGDGVRSYLEKLKNDYVDDSCKMLIYILCLPQCVLKVLSWFLYPSNPLLSGYLKNISGVRSVYDWFHLAEKIEEYKEEFLQTWRSSHLDAIVAPVYPCPAVPLNIAAKLSLAGSWCQLYNLLNYPSGSVPVTNVTTEDIQNLKNPEIFQPHTLQEKVISKACEGGEGLPVGVQCVAQPFQEELVLRIMKDIETGLQSI